jgi:hypothetical protein
VAAVLTWRILKDEWFGGSFTDDSITKTIRRNAWEDWYAWYPVTTISGQRVWMKPISRRVIMKYGDPRLVVEYEYGTVFDILKEA